MIKYVTRLCYPEPLLPMNAAQDEYPELRKMEASPAGEEPAGEAPKPTAAKSVAAPKPKPKVKSMVVFDLEGEASSEAASRKLQLEKQIEFVKMRSFSQ